MDITFQNNKAPDKGKLLLSDPFLSDGYFDRSVVLLCEHNEKGSFGFVLNNYLDIAFEDIANDFPAFDTKVSIGGPVSKENLFFIHTLGDSIPNSEKITPQIYAGGDFQIILDLIQSNTINNHQIRFFVGYSGWGENQLKEELNENAWIVSDADATDLIMDIHNDQLWETLMKQQGKKFERMTNFPQNPNLN